MKLNFTRNSWYALLLASAAATLINACAVLTGADFAFLDTVAFGMTGLAVLFLAAEKNAPEAERRAYFGVFALLLLSHLFGGVIGYLCAALVWPALLFVEKRRGAPVETPLRLLLFSEGMHLALVWAATAGAALGFYANLFWLLTAASRCWAAFSLCRKEN